MPEVVPASTRGPGEPEPPRIRGRRRSAGGGGEQPVRGGPGTSRWPSRTVRAVAAGCVARPDGLPVMFRAGTPLPGERVVARRDRGHVQVRPGPTRLTVLKPAPDRVDRAVPAWPRPGGCGGCDWQQRVPSPPSAPSKAAVITQAAAAPRRDRAREGHRRAAPRRTNRPPETNRMVRGHGSGAERRASAGGPRVQFRGRPATASPACGGHRSHRVIDVRGTASSRTKGGPRPGHPRRRPGAAARPLVEVRGRRRGEHGRTSP